MLCSAYLAYDFTIYHDVFVTHLLSPSYLYELIFHILLILFSPILFMFIGYQDYRKTSYMIELEEMTEKWRKTYDSIPDLIFVLDNDHHIVDANRATFERWGKDIVQKQFCYSHLGYKADALDDCTCLHKISIDSNKTVRQELAGGFIYDITCSPIFGRNGKVIGSVNIIKDITEKRKTEEEKKYLEAQLQQFQKLESLGRFAGGIAHDFNNLLMVIHGNAECAKEMIQDNAPYRKNIDQILLAANKATDLTSSILTFSRKKN